ncbi:MAG: Tim44 domain-containing protein [Desulfobacterium sp.]|nr:Tim44 domain-containing protein [Desulfobacterium sp.]
MLSLSKKIRPIFMVLLALFLVNGSLLADTADARSKGGGRSFKSAPRSTSSQKAAPVQQKKSGSFAKGLAGGLLGGAIGGMLFGSMFGAGGQGMGLLPILLFAGVGFVLFRRFARSRQGSGHEPSGGVFSGGQAGAFGQARDGSAAANMPPPVSGSPGAVEQGLNEIRQTDMNFDASDFLEIASDAFFQVQAGWIRRDLDSYRDLLGAQLASEYEEQFAQMREKGIVNKLESIAIRKVDMVDAGSTGSEDFVTVSFAANLLDYTVDETTGNLLEGSMTNPVKFEEEWTWARSVGTNGWKLEGIKVVAG